MRRSPSSDPPSSCGGNGEEGSRRCFDPAAILAQDHAEHKEKIVSIETRRAQINYALSTATAELQRLREYRRIENDLLAAA